jgi:hypothetical protein
LRELAESLLRPVSANVEDSTSLHKLLQLRHRSLEVRQEIYKRCRLNVQLAWYRRKAQIFTRKSRGLMGLIVITALIAVVLSFVSIVFQWHSSPTSAIGAMSLALLGYLQTRRYGTDAEVYRFTSFEIEKVIEQNTPSTETEWCLWVDDAEEALSREHVAWQASHSGIFRKTAETSGVK